MGRLNGKRAIVTGGASGIGKADCKLLHREGARVIIADISEERGQALAAELGDNAEFQKLDVSNEENWKQVIMRIKELWDGLDILVNNAGIASAGGSQEVEDVTIDEWRKVMAVNVEGVVFGCKHAIPVMRESGGGSIINISSIAATVGTPSLSAYGASKAAVYQYTLTVALYCARKHYNIRCNSVHPGIVHTEILDKAFSKDELEARRKAIPLGDFGEPEDIANAVLFLASDESKHMTGSRLMVTGGIGISML